MSSHDLRHPWALRLGRPLGGFSRSTIGVERWFPVALVAAAIAHFWLAGHLPPAEDELYYWAWAKEPALSYYDHPPLVAWLIALSTRLLGDTLLGIRFFPCLISLAVALGLRKMAGDARLCLPLLLTPLFLLGGVLMTPDVPLVAAWTVYVAWLVGVSKRLGNWSGDPISRVWRSSPVPAATWVAGGLALGLGILGKYTMGLAVPCAFLVLCRYRWRAWLPGFVLHGAVALLVASPILVFNWRYQFAPLAFQWWHATAITVAPRFWDFVGAQVALVGLLPFLMLPWALFQNADLRANPALRVFYFFFTVPFVFFLLKALRGPLEANWAFVAYIALVPLAAALLRWSSFRALNRAAVVLGFAAPIAVTAAFLVHRVHPLPWIAPHADRYYRLQAETALAAETAADARRLAADKPIFASTYQWTAALRFQGLDARQIPTAGRESQFTLVRAEPCANTSALVFEQEGAGAAMLSCFPRRTVLKQYVLQVRGWTAATYALSRYDRGFFLDEGEEP